MTRDARVTCAVCAWRADCRKKFTVTDALHCAEFTRDVTIKDPPESDSVDHEAQAKESNAHEGSA